LILRTKRDVVEQRSEKISDFVEGLEVEKEFKNINTVDDLMKTLEKPNN
jgi:molybdopterin-guanine dinucleotide biosynthesis protein A